jgi:uncharacterized protein involved in exopolysaccharide biosynthesis
VQRTNEVIAPTVEQPRESEQAVGYEALGLQQEQRVAQAPGFQPIDVAWLLWGERRFLARLTAAGLVAFTLAAFLLPKRYTATVHLMPPDYNSTSELALSLPGFSSGTDEGGGGGGGGLGVGSVMGVASKLLGLNTSGSLITGVLQSRIVEDNVVNQFGLMKLYSVRYPEDARKALEGVTEVKEDSKTGIIGLSVEDKDPRQAAAIAQSYVENLNQALASVNASASHRERVFIEQRLAEVKKELDASAKEFSEFASANSAINLPEQAKAMVGAAADLQAKLIAAESLLKGLRQIYTDNNVNVRQMKAEIAELQQQINKFGGMDVTPADGSTLPRNELYPSIRQLPLLGVRYMDLYRRNKIDEAVYELLTKQREIARVQEARDVPSVQVLDPAVVPRKKTSPHRAWIILGGVCFSFLVGSIWLISRAHWERIDPQQPWKILAHEVFVSCKGRSWDSRIGLAIRSARRSFVSRISSPQKIHSERGAF